VGQKRHFGCCSFWRKNGACCVKKLANKDSSCKSLHNINIKIKKYEYRRISQTGKRIKKWREKRNISQEDLTDRAGLYRTYIGHLENGRYSPTAYVLYKIAKALKVEASEFSPKNI